MSTSTTSIFKNAVFYKIFTNNPDYFTMQRFNDLMLILSILSSLIYIPFGIKTFKFDIAFSFVILGILFNIFILNIISVIIIVFGAVNKIGIVMNFLIAWISISPSSMFFIIWLPFLFYKIFKEAIKGVVEESVENLGFEKFLNLKSLCVVVLVQIIWIFVDYYVNFKRNVKLLTESKNKSE